MGNDNKSKLKQIPNLPKSKQQLSKIDDEFYYDPIPLCDCTFGMIYQGINQKSNEKVIVKRIEQVLIDCYYPLETKNIIQNQLNYLSNTKQLTYHVQFYKYIHKGELLFFIYEFCEQINLEEYTSCQYANKLIDKRQASQIILQIAQTLEPLHQKSFIYLDIRPKNIWIQKSIFKLADPSLRGSFIMEGGDVYVAPEVALGIITPEADVWSLGCLFHYILFQQSPNILDNTTYILPEGQNNSKNLDNETEKLLSMMITKKQDRISLNALINQLKLMTEQKVIQQKQPVQQNIQFKQEEQKNKDQMYKYPTQNDQQFKQELQKNKDYTYKYPTQTDQINCEQVNKNFAKQKISDKEDDQVKQFKSQNQHIQSAFKDNKINYRTGVFFKLGYNPTFSESILVYIKSTSKGFLFSPVDNMNELLYREIKITDYRFLKLFQEPLFSQLSKIAYIIIHQHKWGLVLNIKQEHFYNFNSSIHNLQSGAVDKFWEQILRNKILVELFRRYAFYIMNIDEEEHDQKQISIPNSFDELESLNFQAHIPLFPHQRQEVQWMLRMEAQPQIKLVQDIKFVPLLDTGLYFDPNNPNILVKKSQLNHCIIPCKAGVLASDIGCGKTASMISLIESSKVKSPTLIILPNAIFFQWKSEIEKFSPNLKILLIKPQQKSVTFDQLNEADVVLITRESLASGLIGKEMEFSRLILDEIHEITSKNPSNSILINKIQQVNRRFTWGVTGTPENLNYYNENHAFLDIMKLPKEFRQPHTQRQLLNLFTVNFMRKNPLPKALPQVSKITKGGYFQQIQKLIYSANMYASQMDWAQELCSHFKSQFMHIKENQDMSIINAIEYVTSLLAKEIQILEKQPPTKIVQQRLEALRGQGNFYAQVIELIKSATFECPLCLDELPNTQIVVPKCFHQVCESCYKSMKQQSAYFLCPICKEHCLDLMIHPQMRKNVISKLDTLIKYIENEVPFREKIVIFTQFNELANHICQLFQEAGIEYQSLKGDPAEINVSLYNFKSKVDLKVLVMSVEQAASGINLTEANHVIFVHPLFGLDYERTLMTYAQCIGRVHRIGQKKNVQSVLFYTNDSIEQQEVSKFTDILK